jgi:hypothetical protein
MSEIRVFISNKADGIFCNSFGGFSMFSFKRLRYIIVGSITYIAALTVTVASCVVGNQLLKIKLNMKIRTLAFALALSAPLAALAQTMVFNDTLSAGSTLNSANPTPPTATSTSYEELASKNYSPNPPTLTAGDLKFGISGTSGGGTEIQALITTAPVALQSAGQYIQVTATFTATEGVLTSDSELGVGLYNAGQVLPWAGGLNNAANSSTTTAVTGGAQNWVGTFPQIAWQGAGQSMSSDFANRPAQTNPDNRNQVTAVNGSALYGFSNGSTFSSMSASNVNLTAGSQYAEVVTYTLLAGGGLQINAALYAGSPSGTFLTSIAGTNASPLTTTFDAFAMGFRTKNSATPNIIDLNALQVVTTAPYSGGVSCISQSVNPSSLVVGQTNGLITVTVPSEDLADGPLSVDLVSSTPAVAYPGGASGGTLTLTFPEGGYNTTNLSIVAAESGATIFSIANASGGACISDSGASNLVAVACDPITMSPTGSAVSLVGQTNQLITVTISPYANLTGPVTVNLVSSNPSVVTPAGAVNGTLQLTFAANGPTSQSVSLNTLALGSATLAINNASAPVCTAIASNQTVTVTVPQPQGTNAASEDFSSEAQAAIDGWVGYMNTSNGENYGWSGTQNSGGSSAGEAGGNFVRYTNLSYYADITVGPLTLNDYISASGNLYIAPPSPNAAFDICYFNTNNPPGSPSANILGMGLADDGGVANEPLSRLSAAVGTSSAGNGLTHEVFGPTPVTAAVIIPWSINYDPTAGAGYGQLVLDYNYEGTEYVTNVNLSASDRNTGATFNAFGMMVRGVSGLDANVMGIFMSDVSYTKGYSLTPASIPLQISANGSGVTVTWANPAFSLESSTNVAGPYQVIQGASNPYQTSANNAAVFYRLIAQ